MALRSALINVMARAVEKAGRVLVRDFGEIEHLQVSKKGPGDFVTSADTRAEQILREELSRARPDFGFLLEEGGAVDDHQSHRFVIDPLDGTLNFMHGVPFWGISVAVERLTDNGGDILAGVIYDPIADQLFWAEKGVGAFVNHQRLRVSARAGLADALCAASGRKLTADDNAVLQRIGDQSAALRRLGSCALSLAYIAAGRLDGFWCRNVQPWDTAAGLLMVREAGGLITDLSGGKGGPGGQSGHLLVSNYHLHQSLAAAIKG